ncbi:MAG: hypothetical protein M3Y75_02335 [Actinomycetota bacterium]|nr:hypothetical protein [Actinomycetota bacterium]
MAAIEAVEHALGRARVKTAGCLGDDEIEVGGARFAAGDQVITQINDQRAQIFNRERWRVAEVDAASERLVGRKIDTRGRVCVDSDYLGRLRERDGGPAIEHAFAATTYQAQGATVDTAFVTADPSMDRQEFYVATSRTREQAYLYATPEIQFDRDEFAPRSPLREGLDHIAEAAERDGSQASAHDEALRQEFGQLPTDELARYVHELRAEAGAEAHSTLYELVRSRHLPHVAGGSGPSIYAAGSCVVGAGEYFQVDLRVHSQGHGRLA